MIEAVEQGRFHIHTAAHLSDGLELLTGLPSGPPVTPTVEVDYPAESVLGRAQQTLQAYRRACQRAGSAGRARRLRP
ncbi:hypothetical protein FQZ97_1262880 [compost metagenome]